MEIQSANIKLKCTFTNYISFPYATRRFHFHITIIDFIAIKHSQITFHSNIPLADFISTLHSYISFPYYFHRFHFYNTCAYCTDTLNFHITPADFIHYTSGLCGILYDSSFLQFHNLYYNE